MKDIILKLIEIIKDVAPKNRRSMLIPFIVVAVFLATCFSFTFSEINYLQLSIYVICGTLFVMISYHYLYVGSIKIAKVKYNVWTYNGIVMYTSALWLIIYLAYIFAFNSKRDSDALFEVSETYKMIASLDTYTKLAAFVKCYLGVYFSVLIAYLFFGKYILKGDWNDKEE